MSNLQSILENVDTPELLCQSVKCILQVARCYPHVFSTNFRVSVSDVMGPLAIPPYPLEVRGGLESIPADILDRSITGLTQRQTLAFTPTANIESPFNLTCMFLDCERKPR